MKKLLISLLSVGMLLGTFGIVNANNTSSPNVMEETVQADTNNEDQRTINYEVYKNDSNSLSTMNMLFTKTATIDANEDGTFTVTLKARDAGLNNISVSDINGKAVKTGSSNGKETISFTINGLEDLNNDIPATISLKTKVLGLNVDTQPVRFRFDTSSMESEGTAGSFADSLNKITNAENNITNSVNNAKSIVSDLKSNNSDSSKIISTPSDDTTSDTTDTTSDNSNTATNTDSEPKTVLKELTYKIAKNNGDGSLISPYFTNTAKVLQNPDGTYYVEVTIKYPKKFGTNAFEINSINNQKPFNFTFKSEGDSNYITFDFPINKITDLSNLIPGDISLNIPDFGLNKDLGFNLDFDSLNPSDLSSLMNDPNLSGLLSDLSNLGNISSVTPATDDTSSNSNKDTGTLPQTGNQTNYVLMTLGGVVLVLWLVLLKGTYFKH